MEKNKKQNTDLQLNSRGPKRHVHSATHCNTGQPHQHISLRNRSESTSHHSVAIFGFTKVLFFLRSIASLGLLTLQCSVSYKYWESSLRRHNSINIYLIFPIIQYCPQISGNITHQHVCFSKCIPAPFNGQVHTRIPAQHLKTVLVTSQKNCAERWYASLTASEMFNIVTLTKRPPHLIFDLNYY